VVWTRAQRPVNLVIPASCSYWEEKVLSHRRSQSEEETERNGGLSLAWSVDRPRADGFTSKPFQSRWNLMNGYRQLGGIEVDA